jgi:hypothetical protein
MRRNVLPGGKRARPDRQHCGSQQYAYEQVCRGDDRGVDGNPWIGGAGLERAIRAARLGAQADAVMTLRSRFPRRQFTDTRRRSQRNLCVLRSVIETIMKTSRFLLTALLGVLPLAATRAATPQAATAGRAEVAFFEPEKFTDVKDTYMGDYERTTYLDQIRDHLVDRAKTYVPEGHTLSVTFTDIDMAGDFEPWRGPRFDDIRIVKDMYPPRLVFTFQLTDAAGNIVKQGKRDLRDMAFLMKISMTFRDDAVRHEKALLDDWLREEFPRARKR